VFPTGRLEGGCVEYRRHHCRSALKAGNLRVECGKSVVYIAGAREERPNARRVSKRNFHDITRFFCISPHLA
jgi:hypothetical protein